tara:strand:+ start:978 stop:1238 length:261 start_codon:yes stop_codon:yes gene_type:complete
MFFLASLALGEQYYVIFSTVIGSWIGKLIILGITWAIFHHMLGGLRHFIWDIGKGFEVKTVDQLAAITLLGGVLLTLIYWLVFFII